MGRKSKKRTAPEWAYEDNPFSTFGMIYTDLLKSKQYQSLSCATKLFFIVCIAHSRTQEGQECLYNALKERYTKLGIKKSEFDLNKEVHDEEYKKFVFPKKHYEKYGYSKAYVCKCFAELKKQGFIKVVQCGKAAIRVNIYEFSTEWKRKSATTNG